MKIKMLVVAIAGVLLVNLDIWVGCYFLRNMSLFKDWQYTPIQATMTLTSFTITVLTILIIHNIHTNKKAPSEQTEEA